MEVPLFLTTGIIGTAFGCAKFLITDSKVNEEVKSAFHHYYGLSYEYAMLLDGASFTALGVGIGGFIEILSKLAT